MKIFKGTYEIVVDNVMILDETENSQLHLKWIFPYFLTDKNDIFSMHVYVISFIDKKNGKW